MMYMTALPQEVLQKQSIQEIARKRRGEKIFHTAHVPMCVAYSTSVTLKKLKKCARAQFCHGGGGNGDATDEKFTYLVDGSLLKSIGCQRVEISDGISIVSFGHVKTDIVQSLALRQVMIILILQEGRSHSSNQRFSKPMMDVEGGKATCSFAGLWSCHLD